ncbi:MAG: hypothetical protein NVS3B10_26210 [Polyangiales bacterium]
MFKKNALPPTGRESFGVYVQNGDVGYERIVTSLHATARTPATAFIGDWKHVVATYDGALLHLYVDGALRATDNDARASSLAGVPLFVACGDAFHDTVIKGDLDEVAVYDKALSPERVLIHLQTGRGLR